MRRLDRPSRSGSGSRHGHSYYNYDRQHAVCRARVKVLKGVEGVCVTPGEPMEWRFELKCSVYGAGLAILHTF